MAKGYWIAQVDVHDAEAYKGYMQANAAAFAKYGATFLVRGGEAERVEGHFRSRVVILEFRDFETARACYHSPEYAAALAIRLKYSTGDVVIVDGYDGPAPTAAE